MNGEDQFEKRLQGLPPRPVPTSWREGILRSARAEAVAAPGSTDRGQSPSRILAARLSGILWPHPRAWAGLAALWLVVLALNLAAHDPAGAAQEMADRPVRQSPEMRELLKQQEQLLAELVGPLGAREAKHPDSAPHQPRSQIYLESLNT
ncbi:MAG TPA: hypothetical protein VJA21_28985 [Verrucomicrobiae bacterium]